MGKEQSGADNHASRVSCIDFVGLIDYVSDESEDARVLFENSEDPPDVYEIGLSDTPRLPGDIFEREATSVCIERADKGYGFFIESQIDLVHSVSGSLAFDTFDYYAEKGITRLRDILDAKGYRTEQQLKNVFRIIRMDYVIEVCFGEDLFVIDETAEENSPVRKLFPDTRPYTIPRPDKQTITLSMRNKDDNVLELRRDTLKEGVGNYIHIYSNFFEALYKERDQRLTPAAICFTPQLKS